jgi:hypothetical protein
VSWDPPDPRPRARLFCDTPGCKGEVAGWGATMADANTDLVVRAKAAGWKADGMESTFREAQRILGERMMTASDLNAALAEKINVERHDLCPACLAARAKPPEAP